MSRYTKEIEGGRVVAWGFDHALGYFLEVFDAPDPDNPDEELLLISESSMLTSMSNGKMIELMRVYQLPEDHLESVAMNFAF